MLLIMLSLMNDTFQLDFFFFLMHFGLLLTCIDSVFPYYVTVFSAYDCNYSRNLFIVI